MGRGRIEQRTIQAFSELDRECPWLAFLGVRFAARLVREAIYNKTGAVRSKEVVYLLMRLPPELATTQHLMRLLDDREPRTLRARHGAEG